MMELAVPNNEKARAKTLEKKRKILDIALSCFVQHGVEATTIEMIKTASGMSVGSLYHHFGNKDKIAAAIFIESMADFGQLTRDYLQAVTVTNGSAEAGIKALIYANVDWICNNAERARIVFQQRSSLSRGGSEGKWKNDTNVFYRDLLAWFSPAIKQAQIRDLPIELMSSLISGPTHDYARHWLGGRYPVPLHDYRELLAEAAWQAVRT